MCGDAGRIRQVLINLITNAIKYTPDGGRIDIAVQEVSSHLQGYGCLVFTVADTGIGMSKDFLDYIFVPFSRAEDAKACHIQGTGLGMPIALGIVTAMQGNIQVESEPGKGSRFTVTLHLKLLEQEAALLLKSGPSSDQPDNLCDCIQEIRKAAAGRRLLLAEDNELNMEIAQTILGDAGFTVDGAVYGEEAYRRFLDSEPGTYFAILMDLHARHGRLHRCAQNTFQSSSPGRGYYDNRPDGQCVCGGCYKGTDSRNERSCCKAH